MFTDRLRFIARYAQRLLPQSHQSVPQQAVAEFRAAQTAPLRQSRPSSWLKSTEDLAWETMKALPEARVLFGFASANNSKAVNAILAHLGGGPRPASTRFKQDQVMAVVHAGYLEWARVSAKVFTAQE